MVTASFFRAVSVSGRDSILNSGIIGQSDLLEAWRPILRIDDVHTDRWKDARQLPVSRNLQQGPVEAPPGSAETGRIVCACIVKFVHGLLKKLLMLARLKARCGNPRDKAPHSGRAIQN